MGRISYRLSNNGAHAPKTQNRWNMCSAITLCSSDTVYGLSGSHQVFFIILFCLMSWVIYLSLSFIWTIKKKTHLTSVYAKTPIWYIRDGRFFNVLLKPYIYILKKKKWRKLQSLLPLLRFLSTKPHLAGDNNVLLWKLSLYSETSFVCSLNFTDGKVLWWVLCWKNWEKQVGVCLGGGGRLWLGWGDVCP